MLFCVFCCCVFYVFVVCKFGVVSQSEYFGLMFMRIEVLFICSASCVLYSAGSSVKRVHIFLSGLRMRLFVSLYNVFPVWIIKCLFLSVYVVVC